MNPARLLSDETRLEENLGATESLATDSDDVPVWELVGLLLVRAFGRSFHFRVEVERDVAEFLLDIPDDFAFSRGGEGVAALGEDFHQVFREVAARKIKAKDSVRQGIA